MNPSEFRSSFLKTGEPARSNRFDVQFLALPPSEFNINEYRNLRYRCEATELPGKTIGTSEYKDYGPIRKIAYGALYNNQNLTFIVSDDMSEKTLFDRWQKYIVDNTSGSDVKYYDEYVGTIEITQYNRKNRVSKRIQLIEAYPVTMSPMNLGWDTTNEYHRISIEFAYRYWKDVTPTNTSAIAENLISNLF
tara:strand:+ start:3529 stop:4104 length:576 start_codon:yes stop_codon:yes gene_type:complete